MSAASPGAPQDQHSTRRGKGVRDTYTLGRRLLSIRRLTIGRLAVRGLLGILLVGVVVGTLGRLRRWIVAGKKTG